MIVAAKAGCLANSSKPSGAAEHDGVRTAGLGVLPALSLNGMPLGFRHNQCRHIIVIPTSCRLCRGLDASPWPFLLKEVLENFGITGLGLVPLCRLRHSGEVQRLVLLVLSRVGLFAVQLYRG